MVDESHLVLMISCAVLEHFGGISSVLLSTRNACILSCITKMTVGSYIGKLYNAFPDHNSH